MVTGNAVSDSSLLQCGKPQDSVLGPILSLAYTHSLALLLPSHGVNGHFHADDCQIYLSIANMDETKTKFLALLSDIKILMRERELNLNDSKIY